MIRYDTPPEAANDNDLRLGRMGGETYFTALERARAAGRLPRAPDLESPLMKAFRDGRVGNAVAADLSSVATFIEAQVERATRRGAIPAPNAMRIFSDVTIPGGGDLSVPVGPEISADARASVRAMQRSAGDKWLAVYMAVLERATMLDVGLAYGAPIRRAAKEGLAHVLSGLQRIDRDLLFVAERRFLQAIAA